MFGRLTSSAISLACVFLFSMPAAAQVTAADFVPVALGGPTDIKQPSEVKHDNGTVAAASAQDAINAAVTDETQSAGASGAVMVKFPSGIGVVATGTGSYRTMENPVATRIAKREAYVVAYMVAKKNLAEYLNGLSNDGKDSMRQALANVNLPKDEMTNISTNTDESLRQTVEMMLRGFVVYEVKDDTNQSTVYVTLVTTPATRGQIARPSPSSIQADSLVDGINQVIAEVKSGIVPPVGGRIVTVQSTGETAFVGFGSSVVRTDAIGAVQAKLNLESQKIASMRAKDALCGLIIGDETVWNGGATESTKDQVQEFEDLSKDDPLYDKNDAHVKKLDQARQTFVSRLQSTDTYESARKGILPPGINEKTWFNEDHSWAFAMAVYIPTVTNEAARTAQEMSNSQILQPVNPTQTSGNGNGGFTGNNSGTTRPGSEVQQGPTGHVSNDNGL